MTTFSHLLDLLGTIPDRRRPQGRMYRLPHLVLFAILAVVARANSYRDIHSFIDVHLDRLKAAFGLRWRRAPNPDWQGLLTTIIRVHRERMDRSSRSGRWTARRRGGISRQRGSRHGGRGRRGYPRALGH